MTGRQMVSSHLSTRGGVVASRVGTPLKLGSFPLIIHRDPFNPVICVWLPSLYFSPPLTLYAPFLLWSFLDCRTRPQLLLPALVAFLRAAAT